MIALFLGVAIKLCAALGAIIFGVFGLLAIVMLFQAIAWALVEEKVRESSSYHRKILEQVRARLPVLNQKISDLEVKVEELTKKRKRK